MSPGPCHFTYESREEEKLFDPEYLKSIGSMEPVDKILVTVTKTRVPSPGFINV
jgi:hypothetical protein